MMCRLPPLIAILLAATNAHAAVPVPRSFFPAHDTAAFLVHELDIGSFRSSLAPQRRGNEHSMADLGLAATRSSNDMVEFDYPDWLYRLRIVARRDANRDGLEDLEVCFTDQAKKGTYRSEQSLLITRYSTDTPAVAIHFQVEACSSPPRP